jgi:hypothetical protein
MNKPLLLWIALQISVSLSAQSKAEFRKLRPNEAVFLDKLHSILADAIPHSFYNWENDKIEKGFDALKLWCTDPKSGDDRTGYCPVSLGKQEPYSVKYEIELRMPDKQSKALLLNAYKRITDFNSTEQIAGALKSTAVTRIKISVETNVLPGASYKLSYCPKMPPTAIVLPVPATLAIMGLHSDACPIMAAGKVDMTADYYDNALIILGRPAIKRAVEERADGLTEIDYSVGFDRAKTGRLATQNIVVSIHGDAADINQAIKRIDWKKLYYLLGK